MFNESMEGINEWNQENAKKPFFQTKIICISKNKIIWITQYKKRTLCKKPLNVFVRSQGRFLEEAMTKSLVKLPQCQWI